MNMNETHTVADRLRSFGESDAFVIDDKTWTYADVTCLIDEWRDYLDVNGIGAGQVVVLQGTSSPQAIAALLALVERGAIVVPLTALPAAKRDEFHDVAQAEVVITVDDVEGHHRMARTGRHAMHVLYARLRHISAPGLVLFSSGTSGRSKASVLDFTKVLNRYGVAKRPSRTLAFMNIDHIGGINTVLHTVSQGGALITVGERTPEAVFAATAKHKVEVLPTTPTFLNMVLISGAYARHDASSLQLITYGTEPMPLQTLQRLKTALPHVRYKQTYGLSELGILPTKSKTDDSLWIKLGGPGFEYKILDDILWIRSEMAMLGYLNAPAPFDEEGFFNTQDVVETEGEWVRIKGRRSELINVAGEKVYPSEVESVLLELPNVAEATVSGRPSHVTGMVVKATLKLVRPEDTRTLTRRVRQHCRLHLEPFKVPALVEVSAEPHHSERFKKLRTAA